MIKDYGIKIMSYQAGSLYEMNIGVRNTYDTQITTLPKSLLLYYLIDNGLTVEKNITRDIICIRFKYGSKSYKETCKMYEGKIKYRENLIKECARDSEKIEHEEKIKEYQEAMVFAENRKDLFDKKSADEIREFFYKNGVEIRWGKKKSEFIRYKMFFRTTGKAKEGYCYFISEKLYDKAINYIRMGIKLPEQNAPIVEIGAYSSLIASGLQLGTDTITINPRDILVLEDVDSYFTTNVISIETDKHKHCLTIPRDNYKLKNTMFDGQGLIDESIFPNDCDGYVLLREHFCKMACFKTKIQKFFKDYYGDDYETAVIKDMWGNEHKVKDIKLITTDNAMKWIKFQKYGIDYNYWCNKVTEDNNNKFGIVKTAHKSKLGNVQRMSYQMVNSLYSDVMPKVVETSVNYITELKKSDNVEFMKYLERNTTFSNDFEVLLALCNQNPRFAESEYFRERKTGIIKDYVKTFRSGKLLQDADNLVFVGSPYAMLLHSVGEDVETDPTFNCEEGAIQCYTGRFDDDVYLAGFRSPHNSRNNILYLHNCVHEYFMKYFDLGKQIIALNTLHTDVQDRANGCDFDSDMGFVTSFQPIVECAKRAYRDFPTIVNNIPKDTNKYDNSLESFALVDNKLAHAQAAIGTSSNLAQIAQSYMFSFEDQKYIDYVCTLSVLAQVAIDNAKRAFDIDLVDEINRIKKDLDLETNGYPKFWKSIQDKKMAKSDKKFDIEKINYDLVCPMNYLVNYKFSYTERHENPIPMSEFFVNYDIDRNEKRISRKVEEFIEKYSLELYNVNTCEYSTQQDYIVLREDFEDMIEDIKRIYISKNYIGLTSFLLNRALLITSGQKRNATKINRNTNKNRSLLLKTLYDINPDNVLKCFSKNI